MITKELRKKRNDLLNEGVSLKKNYFDEKLSYETKVNLCNRQNEVYKKWMFYNGFIKATYNREENKKCTKHI